MPNGIYWTGCGRCSDFQRPTFQRANNITNRLTYNQTTCTKYTINAHVSGTDCELSEWLILCKYSDVHYIYANLRSSTVEKINKTRRR